MNQQPIGVFDSGIGGISVLNAIANTLPNEDIVYFGDTARMPYGEKDKKTIIRYALENTRFLLDKKAKIIVPACNTIAAQAMPELKKTFGIPVVDIIDIASKAAVKQTKRGIIGVMGTTGTTHSGAYQQTISALDKSVTTSAVACPTLAGLIEKRQTGRAIQRAIAKYLYELSQTPMDTLILGCTHYSSLQGIISSFVGDEVSVLDPAQAVANEVKKLLSEYNMLNDTGIGQHDYFFTARQGG